ncbi:translation initiation factor IF-2 [Columbia Basin potato purple top phytoplasma]|uniref:Translation initiation factor IF-2 n=1 Tax=Columbia Basin potato purple top phytoplasma TaxID=307134 RepID=A0ABT5L8U6_9MOLU|nr:translation initiation factor IF-2 [Columbia Basin potato purple top phytoplasma]MDC9032040.1 translation initiation factor IF-2 [Columbia Basin potato purple top phytoplasma]
MNKKQDNNNFHTEEIKVKSYLFNPKHNVQDLANILQVSNIFLIKKFIELGIKTNINQVLTKEEIEMLGLALNIEIIFDSSKDSSKIDSNKKVENPNLTRRVPIVTIMGHVDHGKTTLLDTIRKTRLVDKEFGGITQHIGAYEINYDNQKITFIDSPGHEAFFQMRSRGAKVTDICLLIVAADDGVKPQTIESVKHAQKAKVEIIVVINKVDKNHNKKESIMTDLSNLGLIPEEWGGTTSYVEISALKKEGIDRLLKVILLISEMKNIQTDLTKVAKGVILEASLDKNKGPSATLLTSQGILKLGDVIVVGDNTYGKIRSIEDDLKNSFKEVYPSQPVLVTGLDSVPQAGDLFEVVENKKIAKQIIESKQNLLKEQNKFLDKENSHMYNNVLAPQKDNENKYLNIILKADTQGSLEAIVESLEKLSVQDIKVNILKFSVGTVTLNDIDFAKLFNSCLINFNTSVSNSVVNAAKNLNVDMTTYNILYKMIDDIKDKLKKLVEPVLEEKVTGKAKIQKIFSISSIGTIAGCYVIEGTVFNNSIAKVIRNDKVIFKGKIVSLKHLKNNISSSSQGHECGILLDDFNDFQIDDIIESSKIEKVKI